MPLPTPVTVPLAPPTRDSVTFRTLLAKVAVTVLAADMRTVQTLPAVEVHPVQPVNAEVGSVLLACRCTVACGGNFCVQIVPQSMRAPGSVPTTVPLPVPFFATLSVTLLKLAVTVRAALALVIVTVHVAPLNDVQPLQLRKLESAAGTAVRTTEVLLALLLMQVVPQLMFAFVPPGGLATPVTVPVPVPALFTVSRAVVKLTVAVRLLVRVALHVAPEMVVHPAQLTKVEPGSDVAVSPSVVPTAFDDWQIDPQLMGALVAPPPGAVPVTVPLPVPVFTTVKVDELNVAVIVLALLMVT